MQSNGRGCENNSLEVIWNGERVGGVIVCFCCFWDLELVWSDDMIECECWILNGLCELRDTGTSTWLQLPDSIYACQCDEVNMDCIYVSLDLYWVWLNSYGVFWT